MIRMFCILFNSSNCCQSFKKYIYIFLFTINNLSDFTRTTISVSIYSLYKIYFPFRVFNSSFVVFVCTF